MALHIVWPVLSVLLTSTLLLATADEQSLPVTADDQSPPVAADEQSPPVTTDEQSAPVTTDEQSTMVIAEGELAARRHHPLLGVQADVGLPDGVGASMLVMPWSWLRLHVGGLATLSGAGLRAGVTLVAFPSMGVRPLLAVDVGYSFMGSAKWLPVVGTLPVLDTALAQVSYAFGSAHLGFEIGSANVAFVIRGGLSYVDLSFAGPRLDIEGASLTASSMSVRGIIPSARVGLLFAFL